MAALIGRAAGAVRADASTPRAEGTGYTLSWDEIVEAHHEQVYRLAWRLTGNREDAEDLTQETFVRVFRSLHTYKPIGRFEGWLHRITTNIFLDGARRASKVAIHSIPEGFTVPDVRGTAEDVFDLTYLDRDIQHALDALPPAYRAAVVLCDLEGLPYEEIAKTLGVKLGTVQSRISRGRALLRESLGHRR